MTRRRLLIACGAWMTAGMVRVRATAPAMRIVSTSPSITEMLFALGLGDRVVGVSIYCRYPPEVVRLPKVGTYLKPDAELVARLRPDLVIIHALPTDLARQLGTLRIAVATVERGTLLSVWSSIEAIAAAAGVPERAGSVVAALQARLAALGRRTADLPRRRVLILVGRRLGILTDMVAVGRDSYLNDLITAAGGINVFDAGGLPTYPRISMETVIRLNPDVIIDTVGLGETPVERERGRLAGEALWQPYRGMLTAVSDGRLYAQTVDPLVVPGPRVVEAAEWLAELLHGKVRP